MPKKIGMGQRTPCSHCGAVALRIVESRPSKGVTIRRRKECEACGHRFTTREITDEQYQQFQESQRILAKVRQWLGGSPVMQSTHVCDHCVHWSESGCGMGFPEAGGSFAEECATFVLQ